MCSDSSRCEENEFGVPQRVRRHNYEMHAHTEKLKGLPSQAQGFCACNRHGGNIPNTVEGLKAIPGIGDYTAGAVASIAFGVQVRMCMCVSATE